jgi:hypothetical protein
LKAGSIERRFMMGDVMTLLEIESTFDAEWVLIEDPEVTELLQVERGKVLWHSKDRDEVYHKARELRPKRSAILYTGRLPEDTVVVL